MILTIFYNLNSIFRGHKTVIKMNKIESLLPVNVWKHFSKLCNIPRPSKKEEKVVEYIEKFGKEKGLETVRDETGNIIIRKPGAQGTDHCKKVVLQAHVDMVPQKNSNVEHDFEKDTIQAYVDGDWVKARGTTLGADNGIGVAAILSVLESKDIEHGPIEALFTVDEETGMSGAFTLNDTILEGDMMLNLDSEEEGKITIGCAGGEDFTAILGYEEEATKDGIPYRVQIKGLLGGHSGLDINKGRGNAIKFLTRFLWEATKKFAIQLSTIEGGSLRNAIPREAFANVFVPVNMDKDFVLFARQFEHILKSEWGNVEHHMHFEISPGEPSGSVFPEKMQYALLSALHGAPNGVIRLNPDFTNVVETSSNLAAMKNEQGKITVLCLVRSSVDSAKDNLIKRLEAVFSLAGAKVYRSGAYPGWDPKPDAGLLRVVKKVYKDYFGKEPEVLIMHAGLECGIIGSKYPSLEMVSIGPTIQYPHSPDEKVHIPSVQRFWESLVEILGNIPAKE